MFTLDFLHFVIIATGFIVSLYNLLKHLEKKPRQHKIYMYNFK